MSDEATTAASRQEFSASLRIMLLDEIQEHRIAMLRKQAALAIMEDRNDEAQDLLAQVERLES